MQFLESNNMPMPQSEEEFYNLIQGIQPQQQQNISPVSINAPKTAPSSKSKPDQNKAQTAPTK